MGNRDLGSAFNLLLYIGQGYGSTGDIQQDGFPGEGSHKYLLLVLALICELDCVCSVGTAVSSIAGSSGVPTMLLLQKSWILLGETDTYPWYPNVKPFVVGHNEHVGVNIKNLRPFIKKRIR